MKTLEEIIKELPENIRLPIYEAFKIFKEDIIHKELTEIKEEIKEVWKAIKELTEAQKRTEKRVEELAEAQKRTEQRVEELAEAQKRTEERLEKLAIRVEELAEAQKRTEERLEKLAIRVEELAEAQKRTEGEIRKLTERLDKLTEEHAKTRRDLGGLAHTFGYVLEDRAMKSLPKILKKNYNIKVIQKLKRDYLKINGEYIEVNIYGKVKKEEKEYTLIGEVKSKISKKMIDKFLQKCEKISKKSIKVLISYVFTPEIKKYAEEKGILLIPSYELEL
jgi:chromosome segregation ATPase